MDIVLFGKKLRNIRNQRGKNLEEVSNAVGIDITFLSKLENGLRRPSTSVLNSLLNHYNLDISEFNTLYDLAGLPVISSNLGVAKNLNTEAKEVLYKVNQQENSNPSQPQINVPNNLPVLYSDVISLTASSYGIVMDYGQRTGPTNQINIVARIGLSKEHAEALLQVLSGKIKEMQLLTKKTDKKND